MSEVDDGVHEGRLILHDGKGHVWATSDPLHAFIWDGDIDGFSNINQETE